MLLFILVGAFAAAVKYDFQPQKRKRIVRGMAVAMFLQFIILPLIGFCVIKMFALDRVSGIMLQVLTSSPGGAYSNWWCSLFNADLMLSVASTMVSNILSVLFLPLSLLIYLNAAYGVNALEGLRWDLLLITIAVVTTAVLSGVLVSMRYIDTKPPERQERLRDRLQLGGNFAGLILIIGGFIFSSTSSDPIWDRNPTFYAANCLPPVLAMVLATVIASLPCLGLRKPERVAVVIECIFQNVGVGMAAALTLFSGSDRARAAGSPLFYGVAQAVVIPAFLVTTWKLGWTYAPANDPLWKVLRHSYQQSPIAVDDGTPSSGTPPLGASVGANKHPPADWMEFAPASLQSPRSSGIDPAAQPRGI